MFGYPGGGGMGGFGFGGGGMPGAGGPGAFDQTYKCFPSSFFAVSKNSDPESYESSDKILLPPSALDQLARLHIDYPMLFELTPHNGQQKLHSGVLEFVAEEGQMYAPFWMMENMGLNEGDLLTVRNACLDKGTYVKFRPQSKSFIDLANPRAVLERTLAKYACLSKGETIRIFYNDRVYDIDVMELKSAKGDAVAVSIIEADVNVDFDAPADYVEPSREPAAEKEEIFVPNTAFGQAAAKGHIVVPTTIIPAEVSASGADAGRKLNGKKKKAPKSSFTGALSPGPMVGVPIVIGAYAAKGDNTQLTTLSTGSDGGHSGGAMTAMSDEPMKSAGNTLRATKA